jgi:ATP-dependent 26S proteasome regulatory subunit
MNETELLSSRFDPDLRAVPYADGAEHLRDWMSFISLCLVSAAVHKIDCAEKSEEGMDTPNLPGTFMQTEEAMCHLSGYPNALVPAEETAEILAAAAGYIGHREDVSSETEGEGVLPLLRIRGLQGLSHFGYFALQCSLASSLDRGFERVFAALHCEEETLYPTLGVVRDLYRLAFAEREAEWLADPSAVENRLLFTPAPAGKPAALRPLSIRPAVLCHILGEPYMSRALASCAVLIDGSEPAEEPLFIQRQLQTAREVLRGMRREGEARSCILYGAAGSGKRLTLKWLSLEENARFVVVRLDVLGENAPLDELEDDLLSLALLKGFTLCFQTGAPDCGPWLKQVLARVRPYRLGVFILAECCNALPEGYPITKIDYPRPDLEQSLHFWQAFSSQYKTCPSVDWAQIASKYSLTAGQIKEALRSAALMPGEGGVGSGMIDDAVLTGNTGKLSKIADKIETVYRWDDLVLGDASKHLLEDVCNRVKYRYIVETQWGAGKKSAYGNGISVLLYGPPGTGKTMSAQVIAGELGLPLYRINIAQIISKYIGETAKNLDTIFNEAKSSNVILFFDEADALFAKRTDIKNSNDRHANSESSYLLQKIEEYSGVSILATNLASNFDEAFRRRINYMINIHMPSPAQRLELWRGFTPPKAPLSADVDFQVLADNLEFSGSVIKSAVLQAAFFAAREGAPIGMSHLAKAARLELLKLGKSEPHFLSAYL